MFIKFILNKPYKHIIRGIILMDKNMDYNYFGMPFSGAGGMYDMNGDYSMNSNSIGASVDPNTMPNAMFNPLMQYEQAYMYYRYLSMQMEYKIKCKEYERLTSKPENSRDSGRKIE